MTIALRNPYTNRKAILNPEDFFGRDREMRDIYARMVKSESVSLVGERRMGKSTLLRAMNFPGERARFGIPEEFRIAYLDMQYVGACTEEEFLEYATMQLEDTVDIAGEGSGRARLKRFAHAARNQGLHVTIVIDEFDVLLGNPKIPGDLYSLLRSLAGDFGLAYVIASREGSIEPLAEKQELGSSFLNIFATINVGPFDPDAARDLLVEPAGREGVVFDRVEMGWLFDLAGYHPFFLQIAAYHLFNLKSDGLPALERYRRLRRDFLFEATPHLDDLRIKLSAVERAAIASLGHAEVQSDSRAMQSLARRGILIEDPAAPGGYRLFSTAFAELLEATDLPVTAAPSNATPASLVLDSAARLTRAIAKHITGP